MIEKPNYTQIPNIYLDEIMKTLNGSENLVFLSIMRKTFGWHKQKDKVSYTQIREATGLGSFTTVKNALDVLESRGLIIAEKGTRGITYEVNIITETVKIENGDDYRNCNDTITETVGIKQETFTETVDTKERNIKKLNKEIYTEITEIYIKEYERLKGVIPVIMYPAINKRLKTLLESGITKEQIQNVIISAGKESFYVNELGYNLMSILSDKVFSRLVNQPYSKTSSSSKKIDTPTRGKHCPECGEDAIFNSRCEKCGAMYRTDGSRIT